VSSFAVLFVIPALNLANVAAAVGRALGMHAFDPGSGSAPLLRLFSYPDSYVIFLPAAGMVSQMIPVFARRPMVGYRPVVLAIISTGVLGVAGWMLHLFVMGPSGLSDNLASV